MRRSIPQFFFAIVVAGGLLLREAQGPPLAGIEETFVNWLAANSSGEHSSAPMMLIEINDNCLGSYPWPWSPLDYALFLKGALQFQARVAAIEPVLAWDEKKLSQAQLLQQPQFEKYLHDFALRTPKLELGAELGVPDDPDVLPPMQPLPVLRNVLGATDAVPEFTVVEAEPGEELRLAAALGFANVPPVETTAMHAPLVFRYRGELVPSFVLEGLMLWRGVTPEEVAVRLGSEIRLGKDLAIPVNRAGAMRVDWKQPYDRAGFDDLELSVEQLEQKHPTYIDPAKLKDRLVILARTDAHSQTLLLPNGRMGSAGELFAAAVATAESNAFARPAGRWGKALVLLLALGLGWTLSERSKLWVTPVALFFCAAYLLLCLALFEATRVALPLTPMLGMTIFVAVYRLLSPEAGWLEPGKTSWVARVLRIPGSLT